jgi:hypothetical protein
MPAPDWLEGLGGAFGGVTRGLTLGAEPFSAWDKVVASGLANDKSTIALRDFERLQQAREAQPDFYGNVIGAADVGNRLQSAKGTSDIYGLNRNLNFQQDISDPNGLFQQMMREQGLTPSDPEYRKALATQQSYYDPTGSVAAYDKFNIPGMQQRNVNEDAVLRYVEAHAHKLDPGAVAFRNPDGTISVIGSDGEEHKVDNPDIAVTSASMLAAKTPFDAVEQGVKLEALIQKSNAEMHKALNDGNLSPKDRVKLLNDERVNWSGVLRQAASEEAAIRKDQAFSFAKPEERDAMLANVNQLKKTALEQLQHISQTQRAVMMGGRMPGGGGGGGGGGLPPVVPQGQPQVTAPRLPPGGAAALAAGGGGGMGPWGQSAAGGAPYPARRVSAQDTGVRAINNLANPSFDLNEYVQQIIQQAQQGG